MKPTVKTRFLLLALFFLPVSLSGCGDDDASDESGGLELLPRVTVDVREGESITTAESSYVLTGVSFRAAVVSVNGWSAEETEKIGDSLYRWEYEAELSEGENLFSIKAVDNNDKESEIVQVTVIRDPDYVPDPPENGILLRFDSYFFWTQPKSSEARAFSVAASADSTFSEFLPGADASGTLSATFSSIPGETLFFASDAWSYYCSCSGTYDMQYEFDFWKAGDNAKAGQGEAMSPGGFTIEMPCCSATDGTDSVDIDGNALEVQYSTRLQYGE